MLDPTWLQFRGAMWWLVGWSNGKSGEELANPDQLDPQYQEDYDRGYNVGAEYSR